MPITKCAASKATPAKGIDYIMDPEKVIARGSQGFVSSDPQKMARQMLQTMHLFGKGFDRDERKYYHAKVSFDPNDRPELGGTLTPDKANLYAAKYAAKTWPGREVVWAVQDHGEAIHIHFIVAACERDTGKKLDARDAEYRQWKDQAQELAKEMGLSALDWRKATKEKREREGQSWEAIDETFAEQGLKSRGKTTWKDELREKIDAAIKSSGSMAEFKKNLEASGVTLTRCTDTTISYKLGDHKACRGDSLGGDYTVAAVRDALQHNKEHPALADPEYRPSLQAKLAGIQSGASVDRVIGLEERQMLRELGRLAGFKRSEIDQWCDEAPKATWEEKQKAWDNYKTAKAEFWEEYNIRQLALSKEIDAAYKRRRKVKNAEWVLNPRNRRSTLFGVIFAAIYLARNDTTTMIDWEIQRLKREQQQLRKDMATFKADTGEAVETLREKGLSLDAYMASVKRMQGIADQIQQKNAALLDANERARLQREAEKKRQQRQKQYDKGHGGR